MSRAYSKFGKQIMFKLVDKDMHIKNLKKDIEISEPIIHSILHNTDFQYYYYIKYKEVFEKYFDCKFDILFTDEEIKNEYINYIKHKIKGRPTNN